MLQEYIKHQLIGTPLEKVALQLRDLTEWPMRLKHPELKEVFLEGNRIETALTRMIQDSTNCIDIGSHLGSMLSFMKQLAPKGQHIAIEPIPYKSKWLQQKYPDVKIFQMALSNTTGVVDFFLKPSLSGFSGLHLNNALVSEEGVQVLQVDCKRLDDIVPADLHIGFMKIDVEGGELNVLRGGEGILQRCRPNILFECAQAGLDAYDFSSKDIYDFFTGHSYGIYLAKDWLESGDALSYEQFCQAMHYPFQAFNFFAIPK